MAAPNIIARMYRTRVWQPAVGPRIVSAFMSDLQGGDLSAQNISCSGNGAPAAGTLPAGFTNYLPGDLYFDAAGKQGYQCTAAGTNATSTWQAIGTGGGGAAVQQFKLSYDGGDYWAAYTWDGSTLGTLLYSIAKPYKLRCGPNKITSETIGGVTYTYTYSLSGGANTPGNYFQRSVSGSDGSSESDLIVPSALQNDIIYAVACNTGLAGMPLPALGASLVSPGTGYAANEVLTVSASTGSGGTPAQIKVLAVGAAGQIETIALTVNGAYTIAVTNPVSAGGSAGTGATFNLTLQPTMIDLNPDARAWASQ